MGDWFSRKTTRLPGYDYNEGAYFLTLCTHDRRCLLSRIVGTGVLDGPMVDLLPFGIIAEKYIKQMDAFYDHISVPAYVIMPNHIHILLFVGQMPSGTQASALQNSAVSRFVSTFKRFCNKDCGQNIWQPRFYDHIIRNQTDFDEHLKYISENPARWQKDDLYSPDHATFQDRTVGDAGPYK